MQFIKFLLFLLPLQILLGSSLLADSLGVKTLEWEDASRGNRRVRVELWYPTEEKTPVESVQESVWLHPEEIRDAKILSSKKKFPLLLMSHGHGGDRRERTWLADALAKKGCVVASVEHFGDTWDTFDPLTSTKFWERPKDVSFALDCLEKDPFLKEQVDFERVGMVGYSMGGMTGLALVGAKVENAKQVVLQTVKSREGMPLEVIETMDFSEAEKDHREPRIRSVLLICPATFGISEHSLKSIYVPVGLIAAIDDEVLPHEHHAKKVIQNASIKKLQVMKHKVSHYTFLNKLSDFGRKIFKKTPFHREDVERDQVHQEVTDFASEFFDKTL